MKFLRHVIKAVLIFITALCHDPITAHEKITEILGIRG